MPWENAGRSLSFVTPGELVWRIGLKGYSASFGNSDWNAGGSFSEKAEESFLLESVEIFFNKSDPLPDCGYAE